jgi:hypothetical protein
MRPPLGTEAPTETAGLGPQRSRTIMALAAFLAARLDLKLDGLVRKPSAWTVAVEWAIISYRAESTRIGMPRVCGLLRMMAGTLCRPYVL